EELTVPLSMQPRRPEPARPHRPDRRDRPQHGARTIHARSERGANGHRHAAERRGPLSGDAAWFTLNVGRSKNADPKWLIPLLCRRGNVTKGAIGKIQILARETRVEIAANAAASFAEAVRRPDPKDPRIHIELLGAAV